MVAAERAKGASAALKVDELRQLLRDKTQGLDTLRRQLGQGGGEDGSAAHHARPSSSSNTRAGFRSSSNNDRRAVDLLRKSGRYSGMMQARLSLLPTVVILTELLI